MKKNTFNENENVHSWHSSESAHEENLKEATIANVLWQWKNNPISIINSMKFWTVDNNFALEMLIQGQKKEWQKQYRIASQKLSEFWSLIFYSCQSKADWQAFESSLEWQASKDRNSIWNVKSAWESNVPNDIWAYFHLLLGQVQNGNELENYRACWNEDKNRVIALVKRLV